MAAFELLTGSAYSAATELHIPTDDASCAFAISSSCALKRRDW